MRGLLDVMGMFNTAPGEPGMIDQIKSAGESFGQMAQDMECIKQQNKMVMDKLDYLITIIDDLGDSENE